jgi:hypothetical protein
MRMKHLIVIVSGMLLCVGCAREDRWTLDGSHPAPVSSSSGSVLATPAILDVQLVQRDGELFLQNRSATRNILVTLGVMPASATPSVASAPTLQVLSLAGSETRVGATAAPMAVSYRIIAADYK